MAVKISDMTLATTPLAGTEELELSVPGSPALTRRATVQDVADLAASTPGGSDTHVQYNDGGTFGGEAGFTYNKSTNVLTVPALTATDLVLTAASATGTAGLRLPHGTAPTSPVNGDTWTTTSGIFARINGSTVGPLGAATPAGSNKQIQYNNSSAFGAEAGFEYDASTNTLTVEKATLAGLLTTAASATGGAGLNLPHGAAPTSPVNGDLWTTSAGGLYARINGATVGPFGVGGGTPAGSDTYMQYNDGGVFGGQSQFAYNKTTSTLSVINVTMGGILLTAASGTGSAGVRLSHGSAPTSPVNGDFWSTSSGFYGRVNGATIGPFGAVGGAAGSDTQVTFNDGGVASGDADFTFTKASNLLAVGNLTIASGGRVLTAASATGGSGLRLPHGSAPTSPVDGDFWTTTSGIFGRVNGATVGPLAPSGGDPFGTGYSLWGITGARPYANGNFGTAGDAQSIAFPFRRSTATGATPIELTTDGATPGSTNRIYPPASKALYGSGDFIIKDGSSGATVAFTVRDWVGHHAATGSGGTTDQAATITQKPAAPSGYALTFDWGVGTSFQDIVKITVTVPGGGGTFFIFGEARFVAV